MQAYFPASINYDEDTSDSISTAQSTHSPDESSSLFLQGLELGDTNPSSCQSKKIRKKRCAYDKIDDDKRLELLESVHRGETLKSAAKRIGVNYSSAKSIFHTYRKEGRILKKAGLEKPLQVCYLPASEIELSPVNNATMMIPAPDQFCQMRAHPPAEVLRPIDLNHDIATTAAASSTGSCFGENSPSSPMRGLTETFGHLFAGFHQTREDPNMLMSQIPNFVTNMKVKQQLANEIPYHQQNAFSGPLIPALSSIANQSAPAHPRDLLKNLDDFYMNYSNSPLSGGRGKMGGDCSDSGSRRYCAKEFDSFSDMVNALQTQTRTTEELQISRALRRNSSHQFKDENLVLNETIGNAAMDTFKSFMDAQWLLCGALKKASYLNNMVQFQRAGISPIHGGGK